ncbi:MAG: hypothetical protein AB8B63_21445 [Granulosicoccus sp.]
MPFSRHCGGVVSLTPYKGGIPVIRTSLGKAVEVTITHIYLRFEFDLH